MAIAIQTCSTAKSVHYVPDRGYLHLKVPDSSTSLYLLRCLSTLPHQCMHIDRFAADGPCLPAYTPALLPHKNIMSECQPGSGPDQTPSTQTTTAYFPQHDQHHPANNFESLHQMHPNNSVFSTSTSSSSVNLLGCQPLFVDASTFAVYS